VKIKYEIYYKIIIFLVLFFCTTQLTASIDVAKKGQERLNLHTIAKVGKPNINFTTTQKKYLKEKKQITMCIDPNWMPYEKFDKNKKHVGMTADYFKIFQKDIGVDIKSIFTKTWSETLTFAKKRKCDIISLAMETPERKEYLNFTTPYLKIPLVIATKIDVPFINEISILENKKIGIPKGYAFEELLKHKYKNLNIIEVKDIKDGLEKVNNGELFGYIGTLSSVGYMFQNGLSGSLKISGKFEETWELGIAVRDDDSILFDIFQRIINNLDVKQQQKILNNWVSVKVDKGTDYTLIIEIMAVVLSLSLFAIYRQYILKKLNNDLSIKVDEKTKELSELNKNLEISILKRTKELEIQKDNFEYLFHQTIEAKALYQDEKCIAANDACVKLFGFNAQEETIGRNAMEFIAHDSIRLVMKNIKKDYTKPYEVNAKKIDGTIFPALIQAQHRLFNGKLTRITSVIDLSELKGKEKALEIAKLKAEESTKLKSEFLANMSHEIRTPMNGIIGMTHLMEKTELNEKQSHYLQTINSSSNSLLSIINDILDFSKIEAGKLEVDKIDFSLKDMINNIANIIEFKATEKSLDFKINYDETTPNNLYGDKLRISQVLINLLNNAVKFTSSGFVKINITNKDDIFRFEIIDSGIGMTPAQQEKLFQSFSQADATTTRKYGGSGLGLSISKQLVELMDGKIWVESKKDIGSTFSFELTLPKAKNNITIQNKTETTQEDIQTLKDSKILLVEDNQINQEIIIGLLENSGLNIDIANNGKEGIELFEKKNYELILMDIQMPIMDGIEATRIIREVNKEIPIIALTANAMKEDIEKTQSVGMNEHLNKPIDVEILYETLLKYISKKVEINISTIESKQEDNIKLPSFKNIDTKIGLSHLGDNKKLYLKVLNDFKSDYSYLKLEELNDEELKRVAHTIKGLSSNLGIKELSKIAKELEETLDRTLFSKLYAELNIVLDELEILNISNNTDSLKEEISSERRDELFLSLKEFVTKRRANKCNEILDELNIYKHNKDDGSLIVKIQELLKNRKYKNIVEMI